MTPRRALADALPAAVPHGLGPGAIFAGHHLVEELGRGGMGLVFSACHDTTDRLVALKIPPPGADAELLARFRAEAEAMSALDHPGIVPVYEVGEFCETPFFTMRLAEGGNLAGQIARFRDDPRAAAALVARVADAIHHAHERGLLHRDIKPANILLAAPGEPLVADFGLARWLRRDGGLTMSGALLGTPGYLAPELLGKAEATIASDVFSVGAVLYHLLAGRAPFAGASVVETLAQLAEADAAPLAANVPRDLAAVCAKCLERDPARRYATAADLAADLRRFLAGEPILARPLSVVEIAWRWCRRRPAVAALLAALGAVVALGFWRIEAARRDEASAKTRAESASAQLREANARLEESLDRIELDRAEDLFRAGDSASALAPLVRVLRRHPAHPVAAPRLASALWHGDFALPLTPPFPTGAQVIGLQFLRDARTLLVCSNNGITTRDAATGRRLLAFEHGGGRITGAVLSPDERTLAVWDESGGKNLRLLDAATGRECAPPIPHARYLHTVAFSPDSARLVIAGSDGPAQLRDARTGQENGGPMEHPPGLWGALFSPDGETIATCAGRTVRWWDSRSQELRSESAPLDSEVRRLRFSPDGHWLLAVCVNGTMRFLSTADGQPAGTPMRHEDEVRAVAFSADGQSLLTASNDHTARLWSVPGGEPLAPPLRHRDAVSFACFSADGARIATCSSDHTTRVWDARTARPLTQPLRHLEQPRAAAFTPDGATLYAGGADGIVQCWDLRPATEAGFSASEKPVPEPAGNRTSADGRFKLTFDEKKTAALLTDARTGAAIGAPLAHLDAITDAAFSPDGALVATAGKDNTARVWDTATGRAVSPPLRHARTVSAVAIHPDSRRVATASFDGTARMWDARTGAPLARALTHDDYVTDVQFSPDGRRIATASRDKTVRVWDAASGQPLTEPLRHDAPVEQVRFQNDGQRIVASTDDSARIWDVPDFPTPPPAWLPQLAEIISLTELPTDPAAALALIARYEQTRAAALATTGDGNYARLARRLFSTTGETAPR